MSTMVILFSVLLSVFGMSMEERLSGDIKEMRGEVTFIR